MRRVRVSTLAKGWSPHSWMNKWNEFEKKRIRIWGSNFTWHWIHYEDGYVPVLAIHIKDYIHKLATNDVYKGKEWKWLTGVFDDGYLLHDFLEKLDHANIGKDATILVDLTDPYVKEFLEKVEAFEREEEVH